MQRYPAHYLKQFHVNYVDKAKLDAMAKAAGFEQWFQLYNSKHNLETNPEHPTINAWNISEPAPAQPVGAERNPYYWKVDSEGNQLPYIDRVEWMVGKSRTGEHAGRGRRRGHAAPQHYL